MRLIIFLIIGSTLCLNSSFLYSQQSTVSQTLSYNEIGVFGQYKIYNPPIVWVTEGENFINSAIATAYEFGLSYTHSFNSKSALNLGFSYSETMCRAKINEEYIAKLENHINSRYSNIGSFYWGFYMHYNSYKSNLNYIYYLNIPNSKQALFLGAGIGFIHYQPYSTQYDNTVFYNDSLNAVFLICRNYINSRYENGQYNKYRAVDLGLNFLFGYKLKLFKQNYLSFDLNYFIQPRNVHIVYFETTSINPYKSTEKIIYNMNNLALKISYVYRLN